MNQRTEKIRPPTHSSFQSDPKLRAEAEDDLPDQASAPDPMANRGASEPGAINVNADAGEGQGPYQVQGTLTPSEAARLRSTMGEPNQAYGKPYRSTDAERLQQRYHTAWEAYKADYQGTRSERLQQPYLEAKQAMIDAGLMVGDV